jgi:hypothetical protein
LKKQSNYFREDLFKIGTSVANLHPVWLLLLLRKILVLNLGTFPSIKDLAQRGSKSSLKGNTSSKTKNKFQPSA